MRWAWARVSAPLLVGLMVVVMSALAASPSAIAEPRSYKAEELKEQGYVDEQTEPTFGSFSHTLLALGPGALIHGVGHWQMGDEVGGWLLFGAQLTGLVALGGVSLTRQTRDVSSPSTRIGVSGLSHLGWGLVLGSWVLDVVGSYQGGLNFEPKPKRLPISYLSLGYRYLEDRSSNLANHIVAGHTLKYSKWKLSTKFDLSNDDFSLDQLSALKLFGVTMDVSAKLLSTTKSPVKLNLGLNGRRWQWVESDATQLALVPYLQWDWPLKRLARGLTHTVLFQRLGYGWEGYQSPRAEALETGLDPSQLSTTDRLSSGLYHKRNILKIETGLRVKLSPEASLTTSYLEDPTLDVYPRAWGERVYGLRALGLVPNQGFWRAKLILRQSQLVKDLITEVVVGDSWSSWLVLRWALGGAHEG